MLKQQCYVVSLYLSWGFYLGGFAYLLVRGRTALAAGWLVVVPLATWAYVRAFPRISFLLGYGRIDDDKPVQAAAAKVRVTLYTALACPFCPIVEQRLAELRRTMGFDLQKVDVTLHAATLVAKGIRSVPVVEVGDRRLVGNATSRQLAELIAAAA